jgi:hypothetical protein
VRMKSVLQPAVLVLLVGTLALAPLGCLPGGKELAMAFVEEWMEDNNISPTTFVGFANIGRRLASGSTGDPKADAALATANMIRVFLEAESLMDKGRKTDNATAMEGAIKLRPNDWSYLLSRSTLALKQGEEDKGSAVYSIAYNCNLRDENRSASTRFYNQVIIEYEAVVKGTRFPSFKAETQAKVYNDLREAYQWRYDSTKDINDGKMADLYRAKYDAINKKK